MYAVTAHIGTTSAALAYVVTVADTSAAAMLTAAMRECWLDADRGQTATPSAVAVRMMGGGNATFDGRFGVVYSL